MIGCDCPSNSISHASPIRRPFDSAFVSIPTSIATEVVVPLVDDFSERDHDGSVPIIIGLISSDDRGVLDEAVCG